MERGRGRALSSNKIQQISVLKQHSVVDVLTALILSCLSYDFIYNERTEKIRDGLEELKFRRKRKEFSKY